MNIPSILRHWITLALTAATLWLAGHLLLSPDDSKQLNESVGQLVGPLVIIGTLLINAVYRIALTWFARLFQAGTGEQGESKIDPSGWGVLIIGTMAVFGGLPSCSPEQLAAVRAVPIKACAHTDHGDVCYSTKDGLSLEVDASSRK